VLEETASFQDEKEPGHCPVFRFNCTGGQPVCHTGGKGDADLPPEKRFERMSHLATQGGRVAKPLTGKRESASIRQVYFWAIPDPKKIVGRPCAEEPNIK